MNIEIELDNGLIYIGTENGSGCKYEYKNKQDIIKAITEYVENYVEL